MAAQPNAPAAAQPVPHIVRFNRHDPDDVAEQVAKVLEVYPRLDQERIAEAVREGHPGEVVVEMILEGRLVIERRVSDRIHDISQRLLEYQDSSDESSDEEGPARANNNNVNVPAVPHYMGWGYQRAPPMPALMRTTLLEQYERELRDFYGTVPHARRTRLHFLGNDRTYLLRVCPNVPEYRLKVVIEYSMSVDCAFIACFLLATHVRTDEVHTRILEILLRVTGALPTPLLLKRTNEAQKMRDALTNPYKWFHAKNFRDLMVQQVTQKFQPAMAKIRAAEFGPVITVERFECEICCGEKPKKKAVYCTVEEEESEEEEEEQDEQEAQDTQEDDEDEDEPVVGEGEEDDTVTADEISAHGEQEEDEEEEKGHKFCRECVKGYVEAAIDDAVSVSKDASGLQCMMNGCNGTIKYPVLRKCIPKRDKQTRRRLWNLLTKHALMESGIQLEECIYCTYAQEFEQTPDVNKVFECLKCYARFCRVCKVKWSTHMGQKCDEVKASALTKEDRVRLELEEALANLFVRKCGHCGKLFQKIDGCNKMTCSCGKFTCYVCNHLIAGYDHFCNHPTEPGAKNCPTGCGRCMLWADADKERLEMGNAVLERFKGRLADDVLKVYADGLGEFKQ